MYIIYSTIKWKKSLTFDVDPTLNFSFLFNFQCDDNENDFFVLFFVAMMRRINVFMVILARQKKKKIRKKAK